jgi:GNAT superfamily N-acetyltransferase
MHPRQIDLVVQPAARGNGVGTALFERLLQEAGAHGIAWLTFTGPADDALLRMAATSGSICARRVAGNLAKSVILVPEPQVA